MYKLYKPAAEEAGEKSFSTLLNSLDFLQGTGPCLGLLCQGSVLPPPRRESSLPGKGLRWGQCLPSASSDVSPQSAGEALLAPVLCACGVWTGWTLKDCMLFSLGNHMCVCGYVQDRWTVQITFTEAQSQHYHWNPCHSFPLVIFFWLWFSCSYS